MNVNNPTKSVQKRPGIPGAEVVLALHELHLFSVCPGRHDDQVCAGHGRAHGVGRQAHIRRGDLGAENVKEINFLSNLAKSGHYHFCLNGVLGPPQLERHT